MCKLTSTKGNIMRVYRFENEEGRGPWVAVRSGACAYDRAQRTRNRYHSCGDMPSPASPTERGSHLHDVWRERGVGGFTFGFASLAQLKEAFPSGVGRAAMAQVRQRLCVFEVDEEDVIQGHSQVIFRKRHATLVEELDLRTLKTKTDYRPQAYEIASTKGNTPYVYAFS